MPSPLTLVRLSSIKTPSAATPSCKPSYKGSVHHPSFMKKSSVFHNDQIPSIVSKAISIAERARQGAYSSPTMKLHTITSQKRFYSDIANINTQRKIHLIGNNVKSTTSDFISFIKDDGLLVDKSLFVEEFWNNSSDRQLIVRPRRFGKTSLMSLLQCFFAEEVNGIKTKGMFNKFAIAKVNNGEFLQQHQGQYPVIFVSFKDCKETSYEKSIDQFRTLIKELYSQHQALLTSPKIDEEDQKDFLSLRRGVASNADLANALKTLSRILYKAYDNKKIIILIDEYDAPLTAAYENKFSDELGGFMRNLFSAALKDNPYVQKSLMTGVLRVSQSSMLSGLNNLVTYSVLNPQYQQAFGFEEIEVQTLLTQTKVIEPGDATTFQGVKELYKGYKVGHTTLYNPWSIMQLISQQDLKPYWVLTANDVLLKKALIQSSEETKAKLARLMLRETIECEIDTNLRYEDLMEKPETIWTLLLFGGYLTESIEQKKSLAEQVTILSTANNKTTTKILCQVQIPNQEIAAQYEDIFAEWLKESIGADRYYHFLRNLAEGKMLEFVAELQDYMTNTLSSKDVGGNNPQTERFYHGFMAGLIASLKYHFEIHSNKEGGSGFYDLALVPRSKTSDRPIIIIECKRTNSLENLEKEAKAAVAQVETKQYVKGFVQTYAKVKDLEKIQVIILGLAFKNKMVKSHHKQMSLTELVKEAEVAIEKTSSIEDTLTKPESL